GYIYPRLLGIAGDVGAHTLEYLSIDVDPGPTCRVLRLAKDVGAVVDAVEIDRVVVVAHPFMRRRGQADHAGQRRPGVDMRHHLIEMYACLDVVWPPHQGRYSPTAFERRSLLTAEWRGSGVRIGI